MLGIFLKSSIAFVASFIILSFHISNKPIFYHVTEIVGPLGIGIQNSFKKSIKRSIKKSKQISSNVLTNTNKHTKVFNDKIQSSRSSVIKRPYIIPPQKPTDNLLREEKLRLDKVIDKN